MCRSKAMGCFMSKCIKCGVRILDQTEVCPLCRCVVETEQGEAALAGRYPDIRLIDRKLELVGRIVLFISIVLGALAVVVNYLDQTGIWWSAIVVGGLAYLLLIMFFMIQNDHAGYRSKVMTGMAGGIAYLVLIDNVLGFKHWSLDYVVPAALVAFDILIVVFMFVNIRNWQSYLLFQIFMILCSGVCVILYCAGIIKNPFMSYVAFGSSWVLFLASFIIGGKRASNELKRRFHLM